MAHVDTDFEQQVAAAITGSASSEIGCASIYQTLTQPRRGMGNGVACLSRAFSVPVHIDQDYPSEIGTVYNL